MKNIILIGIMGCGKSTIGKELAKRLNKRFIDMDKYIEEKYKMSIKDMFNISEEYFRERESIVCKELSKLNDCIIASGGGIIKNKDNLKAFSNDIIIYIDRPIESIIQDIDPKDRPLLKEGTHILYNLYQQRHPLYKQYSDYCLYNDKTLEDIIKKIMLKIQD